MKSRKDLAGLGFVEFIALVSMLMSLTALSIDATLAALPQISIDLDVEAANRRQLVISMLFLGLAIGQLFFGPLSDRTGRKTAISAGMSATFLGYMALSYGEPPLWLLIGYLEVVFFCLGILFGILNAAAMAPLGRVAGFGAAFVGSFSTLIAVLVGTAIGQAYEGSVLPLIAGMGAPAFFSLFVVRWATS